VPPGLEVAENATAFEVVETMFATLTRFVTPPITLRFPVLGVHVTAAMHKTESSIETSKSEFFFIDPSEFVIGVLTSVLSI
jgi:hypothetical protein